MFGSNHCALVLHSIQHSRQPISHYCELLSVPYAGFLLNHPATPHWWLPDSTIKRRRIKGAPRSLYKPIGGLSRTTNDGSCSHTLYNVLGENPRRELRMGGATSAKPTFQVWVPRAKIARLRSQCSKRSDAGVYSKHPRKQQLHTRSNSRKTRENTFNSHVRSKTEATKIHNRLPPNSTTLSCLATRAPLLTGFQRSSHLYTNPPMSCVHSIYPTKLQGHSIPSYTSSLHRTYITSLCERFQSDSPMTTIPCCVGLTTGGSRSARATLWAPSPLVWPQQIQRIPFARICGICQPIGLTTR